MKRRRGKNQQENFKSFPLHLPMTVREAQKLLGKEQFKKPLAKFIWQEVMKNPPYSYYDFEPCQMAQILAYLARLSQKDPNQVLVAADGNPQVENSLGEYAPKDTEEVNPAGEDPFSDSSHGGNNSSQEVPDAFPSGGNEKEGENDLNNNIPQPQGRTTPSNSPHGEGSGDPQDDYLNHPASGSSRASAAPRRDRDTDPRRGTDNSQEEMAQTPAPQGAGSPRETTLGSGGSAAIPPVRDPEEFESRDAYAPAPRDEWGQEWTSFASTQPSSRKRGEATASLREAGISPPLFKLCRQRLAALTGGSDEESGPRVDWKDFCIRQKSFQSRLTRRLEEGRPAIAILADISGSCSAFSEESLKVAKVAGILGIPGAEIISISHFNGDPIEMEINGKYIPIEKGKNYDDYTSFYKRWYGSLIDRLNIKVVVALGDWDAAQEYLYIIQHPNIGKFIWLDNANSSRGVKNLSNFAIAKLGEFFPGTKKSDLRRKLIYKDGCRDAVAFIKNI